MSSTIGKKYKLLWSARLSDFLRLLKIRPFNITGEIWPKIGLIIFVANCTHTKKIYTGGPSKLGIKHSKVLDLTYEVWNLLGHPVAASVILTAFFEGTARTCANCRLYIKCTRVVNTKATSTTTLVLLT